MNNFNEYGKRQGYWKETWGNIREYRCGYYVNGIKVGKWCTYDDEGLLVDDYYFNAKGLLHGTLNAYSGGEIFCSTEYKDGEKHGYEKHYFNNGNSLCNKFFNNKGYRCSEVRYYHDDCFNLINIFYNLDTETLHIEDI